MTLHRSAAITLAVIALLAPAHAAEPQFVIGPGDVVRFNVYQNQDLATEARVSEAGAISFPLLGQVALGGLTVAQAEKRIADELRERRFVKDAQVTALVMQMKSNLVAVLGQVNRPGRYPIEVAGMRMSEMLAQAGGTAPGGSDVVTLMTRRDGWTVRLEVDLHAVLAKTGTDDPVLAPGDVLYVDRMQTVYIHGEVQRPGMLRLERDMTVMQAVAAGGGVTQRGTTWGLRVHRRSPSGEMQELRLQQSDVLRDGDVVYVRESIL